MQSKSDVAVHPFNPRRIKAGGSLRVQDQTGLHKIKVSRGYIVRFCLKTNKQNMLERKPNTDMQKAFPTQKVDDANERGAL